MQNEIQLRRRRRLIAVLALSLFLLSAVDVLLSRVFISVSNDVILSEAGLPIVLDLGETLLSALILFLGYGMTVHSVTAFGFRGTLPTILTVCGMTVYRYAISFLLYLILSPGTDTDSVSDNLSFSVGYIFIEFAQYALILLIIAFIFFSRQKKIRYTRQDGKYIPVSEENPFPYPSKLSFDNPVEASAFFAALVMMVFNLISRLRYDLFLGAPDGTSDLLWMIGYYTFDVLLWGIGGYIMILVVAASADKYLRK